MRSSPAIASRDETADAIKSDDRAEEPSERCADVGDGVNHDLIRRGRFAGNRPNARSTLRISS